MVRRLMLSQTFSLSLVSVARSFLTTRGSSGKVIDSRPCDRDAFRLLPTSTHNALGSHVALFLWGTDTRNKASSALHDRLVGVVDVIRGPAKALTLRRCLPVNNNCRSPTRAYVSSPPSNGLARTIKLAKTSNRRGILFWILQDSYNQRPDDFPHIIQAKTLIDPRRAGLSPDSWSPRQADAYQASTARGISA
jgi:hypothetical protein